MVGRSLPLTLLSVWEKYLVNSGNGSSVYRSGASPCICRTFSARHQSCFSDTLQVACSPFSIQNLLRFGEFRQVASFCVRPLLVVSNSDSQPAIWNGVC